jgi:hypothetical protein
MAELLSYRSISGKTKILNEVEGRLIFEYIRQESDLFRILLKSQSVSRIRKSVIQNISMMFQNSCGFLQRSNSHIPANIASNHMATSLLALIEWWLENKMSPPPPQMGKIYKALIVDAPSAWSLLQSAITPAV